LGRAPIIIKLPAHADAFRHRNTTHFDNDILSQHTADRSRYCVRLCHARSSHAKEALSSPISVTTSLARSHVDGLAGVIEERLAAQALATAWVQGKSEVGFMHQFRTLPTKRKMKIQLRLQTRICRYI
jgi:hypothetical protein